MWCYIFLEPIFGGLTLTVPKWMPSYLKSLSSILAPGCLFFSSSLSFSIPVTDTLPQNVRAFGLVLLGSDTVRDLYNENSQLEPLAQPLNRKLSMSDLATRDQRLALLKNALNSYGPFGLGDDLIEVDLSGDVSVTEKRQILAFLWGISDELTVGAFLPYISRTTLSSLSASSTKKTQQLRQILGQTPEALEMALREIDSTNLDTNFFIDQLFVKNGLKVPGLNEKSGLGDLELESRYRFYRGQTVQSALRFTTRVPTGQSEYDVTNVFDRPLGQGHPSFKLGSFTDIKLVPRFLSWNSGLAYTTHLSQKELRAVKKSPEQDLPNVTDPDQIENVSKYTGGDFRFESGLMMDFMGGLLNISSTYVVETHSKDRYLGNRGLDYSSLADKSNTRVEAFETSLEVSSIQAFLDKKFLFPGKVVLTWFQPFRGLNAPVAAYGRVDLVVLF